jgi:uncharacterized protein YjbI with pentapeptide repeats
MIKIFRYAIGTNFQGANLSGANFTDAMLKIARSKMLTYHKPIGAMSRPAAAIGMSQGWSITKGEPLAAI